MQICEINWEDQEERNKSEETLISHYSYILWVLQIHIWMEMCSLDKQ